MSAPEVLNQLANPIPPRRGNGFALTVDGTVRVYDISSIAFSGSTTFKGSADKGQYLTLHADGGDIYFRFQSVSTADMVTATVISAGGTIALSDAFAQKLPSGAFADVRIDRLEDKYLSVTGSGTLRVHASSQAPK